jgi:hypothetical protein
MTRPYQPSNGSEGEGFHAAFCDHCARDAAFRETNYEGDPALGCQILADSFAYRVTDPEYPKEWIQDDDGGNPRCTAFTTDPSMPVRCDKTADMFFVAPQDGRLGGDQ